MLQTDLAVALDLQFSLIQCCLVGIFLDQADSTWNKNIYTELPEGLFLVH